MNNDRIKKIEELRKTNEVFVSLEGTIAGIEKFLKEDLDNGITENIKEFLELRKKLIIRWSEITGLHYRTGRESMAVIKRAAMAIKGQRKRRAAKKEQEELHDKRIIRIRTKNFERLSKNEALHFLMDKKEPIYMFPNKVLPDNLWIPPAQVNPGDVSNKTDFDRIINGFKFYNCNLPYLGTYVSYYKKIS